MTDTNYRDVTVSSKVCLVCGALVADKKRHDVWHVDRQPAPEPDPWKDEVAAIVLGDTEGHWDMLFDHAVRHTITCMWEQGRSDKVYRLHLVHVAARVRAMAPEGTQWEEAWQVSPGTERNTLRSVIRSLVHADTKHGHPPADTAGSLVSAESYLHGLWLASKEEG